MTENEKSELEKIAQMSSGPFLIIANGFKYVVRGTDKVAGIVMKSFKGEEPKPRFEMEVLLFDYSADKDDPYYKILKDENPDKLKNITKMELNVSYNLDLPKGAGIKLAGFLVENGEHCKFSFWRPGSLKGTVYHFEKVED